MPLFICEKCECIENTAIGHYWAREHVFFREDLISPELKGKPLCSDCIPTHYKDGTPVKKLGWHGRFPKEHWSTKFDKRPIGTW